MEHLCNTSKQPSNLNLSLGFEWHLLLGVWTLVPKKHTGKFKDQNPCLEGFSEESVLDDLVGDPLEETSPGSWYERWKPRGNLWGFVHRSRGSTSTRWSSCCSVLGLTGITIRYPTQWTVEEPVLHVDWGCWFSSATYQIRQEEMCNKWPSRRYFL